MRLVILESPYAGDIARNTAYARRAMADCLARGEAPIASHLLYTQPGVLDDDVPEQRKLGIDAGLAWGGVADAAVFYVDLGMSPGMDAALNRHHLEERPVELRRIFAGQAPAEWLLANQGETMEQAQARTGGKPMRGRSARYIVADDAAPLAQAQFRMRANDDNPTDADLLWGWK